MYTALTEAEGRAGDHSLQQFLRDEKSTTALATCLAPYPTASAQSKADLDTRTSAVNVAPSSEGRYDVSQIKNDAIWLSKEADIDEITALRIAILEWQSRPLRRLVSCKPERSSSAFQSPAFADTEQDPESQAPNDNGSNTASDQARQNSLLCMLITERRYLIKVAEYFASAYVCHEGHSPQERDSPRISGWAVDLGSWLIEQWDFCGISGIYNEVFFVTGIDALRSRLRRMETGCKWLEQSERHDLLEAHWQENQILEFLHILQLLLVSIQASTRLTRSDVMLVWFRFMAEHNFFDGFEYPFEIYRTTFELPFQALIALVSTAVLGTGRSIEGLYGLSGAASDAANTEGQAPYLLNPACITEINDILVQAAEALTVNASTTVFAWSVITQTIRLIANDSRESRESQQTQRIFDKYGNTDFSDTDLMDRSSIRSSSSFHRRSSTGSDLSQQPLLLEEHLDRIKSVAVDGDPITYLARSAVDGSHVLEIIVSLSTAYATDFGHEHAGMIGVKIRGILLDVLRAAVDLVPYQPQMLLAVLAVLTGSDYPDNSLEEKSKMSSAEPASTFLNDVDLLIPKLYTIALDRFPYEFTPFLRICRALATVTATDPEDSALPAIWSRIQSLESYTCVMPSGFNNYSTIQEEEDANLISLTSELHDGLDSQKSRAISTFKASKMSTVSRRSGASTTVPSGTMGRVLSETRPFVVMWRYDYPLLEFLGKYLQTASLGSAQSMNGDSGKLRGAIPDAVGLITTLISSTQRGAITSSQGIEAAQVVLEESSNGLDRNEDIISIICSIFEDELHRRRPASDVEGSVDILVQCAQFITIALSISPDRIWSYLGRSSLLGLKDGRSQLSSIITSTEMVIGRYDFFRSCIDMFDVLLHDHVTHCLSRNVSTKAVARFGRAEAPKLGISEVAMKVIFQRFSRISMDAIQNLQYWKFIQAEQRIELWSRICGVFSKMLSYFFSTKATGALSLRLKDPLAPAVQDLVGEFLGKTAPDGAASYLLGVLHSGVAIPQTTLAPKGLNAWARQVMKTLELITMLLRIQPVSEILDSGLNEMVFKAMPTIMRLFAAHHNLKKPISDMIAALISRTSENSTKVKSLISAVSKEEAAAFLEILAVEDKPFSDITTSTAIWQLLDSFLQGDQQWFASLILTGKPPTALTKREGLKDKKAREALLSIALDALSQISRLAPERSSALLNFLLTAADYWPSTLATIGAHPDFLSALSGFLRELDFNPASKPREAAMDFEQPNLATLALDLITLYVRHVQLYEDSSQYPQKLLGILQPLVSIAIFKPTYNVSLHQNLQKNFESRFPPYSISDFQNSSLTLSTLGDSFFYNINLMENLLDFDASWHGSRDQGFKGEFQRANINLSAVEAQIHLFHSWKSLAIALSDTLSLDRNYQKSMVSMIKSCLTCNVRNDLPQNIFERLCQSRADMAIMLLQRLVEAKAPDETGCLDILPIAWNTLRTHETNMDDALSSPGAFYYRTLLRILCISLQPHVSSSTPAPSTSESMKTNKYTSTTIPIITNLIAPSFRSMTSLLHTSNDLVFPTDFALLTALLRSALQTPQIDRHTSTILTAFATNQTAHCAATLLSWADQLATDGDPIYGELSLGFLVEMSSLPALAESLATEGVLTRITGTNIFQHLRDATHGVSPFDNLPRMYTIWAKGFLPLCLNLLFAVGAPIAAEIAGVLTTFPKQLASESDAFSPSSTRMSSPNTTLSSSSNIGTLKRKGLISLSQCTASHTLTLISLLLATFREAGASAGIISTDVAPLRQWDQKAVLEDVKDLLEPERRGNLRERIVPCSEVEEGWLREEPTEKGKGVGCESLLEEKVVGVLGVARALLEGATGSSEGSGEG